MEKKVLITGITGFAGSHLSDHLLEEGHEVHGISRWRSQIENIEHLKGRIFLHEADLLDPHSLFTAVEEVKPKVVFHLAAQSFVPTSWSSPSYTLETNVVGTAHLFEVLRRLGENPLILIAGSSEEYGLVHENELPIAETSPLRPLSPYAVSKVAMDHLGYQYFKSYGMRVIRVRAFNHTGPRQAEVFIVPALAKQIVEVEKGKREALEVGNLESVRDFTDVRDVARAYRLAIEKCQPGEVYNISTGKGWRVREILEALLELSEVGGEIRTIQDPRRMRPSDVPVLIGDSTKFRSLTGWEPEISFEKTLEDTLNFWRERV